MSKIGRKPIELSTAKVEVKGNEIFVSGPKAKFTHVVPDQIKVELKDNSLIVSTNGTLTKKTKALWGLHRALLANAVQGVLVGFEKRIKIVGLGYKAMLSGKKMTFALGYSHKLEYNLPDGVEIAIDRTGQKLTLKSSDKFLLGNVCADIKSFRKVEPYKGTGIMFEDEVIVRKAGKAKSTS